MSSAGLREHRKATNRKAILESAIQVFSELGYEASTVRDIVRSSGLATGTFYNYFQSKEEVLHCIVQDASQQVRQVVEKARKKARNAREFLYEGYLAFLRILSSDPRLLQMLARNQAVFRSMVFGSASINGDTRDRPEASIPLQSGPSREMASGQKPAEARSSQRRPNSGETNHTRAEISHPDPGKLSVMPGAAQKAPAQSASPATATSSAVAGIIRDLESDLIQARENGLLRVANEELTALSIVGAGFEILLAMARDSSLSPEHAAEFLSDLFLHGLSPSPD